MEYSYALTMQFDCVFDSNRMIIQAKKRLEKIKKSQFFIEFGEININFKTIYNYLINLNI